MSQRCWECGRETFGYGKMLHYVGCVHEVKSHAVPYVKSDFTPLPVTPPPSRLLPNFRGPWIRI